MFTHLGHVGGKNIQEVCVCVCVLTFKQQGETNVDVKILHTLNQQPVEPSQDVVKQPLPARASSCFLLKPWNVHRH